MKGILTHVVTIGDSLQKLARMYGIDDWRSIAELNGLESPYLYTELPTEKYKDNKQVANVGDTILIPTQDAYKVENKNELGEIESESYGRDLALYRDYVAITDYKGRLTYDTDIDRVEGLANLAQQLMTRLSVKKGNLLMHPDYGSNLHRYLGKRHSQENINKILFEVESCLRSDFRVKEVTSLKAEVVDDKTFISGKVIPIPPGKPFMFQYHLTE